VHHGPAGEGDLARFALAYEPVALAFDHGVEAEVEGGGFGGAQRGDRPLFGRFGAEHEAKVGGVFDGEAHVGVDEFVEARARVGEGRAGLDHGRAHLPKTLFGDAGQQRGLVGEVAVDGRVSDADALGEIAQGQTLDAPLGNERERGVDELAPQIARRRRPRRRRAGVGGSGRPIVGLLRGFGRGARGLGGVGRQGFGCTL
jgi:hypothetical protein